MAAEHDYGKCPICGKKKGPTRAQHIVDEHSGDVDAFAALD